MHLPLARWPADAWLRPKFEPQDSSKTYIMYIYIYIYREREREMYTCMCVYIYIYIHIHTHVIDNCSIKSCRGCSGNRV